MYKYIDRYIDIYVIIYLITSRLALFPLDSLCQSSQ